MTRHGLSDPAAAPNAPWPAGERMRLPKSSVTLARDAAETAVDRHLTRRKITPIGSDIALPDHQRLPTQTIPKPIYP
jgi:hypothetical protein